MTTTQTPPAVESWRTVWRDGFVPLMTTEALTALRDGLRSDDPALLQGATSCPPPLMCVQDWPCEGGCLIGYAGWKTGAATVGEVEEYFARLCYEADQRLGNPADCLWLLKWWDDSPRDVVRAELLAEVELALAGRNG